MSILHIGKTRRLLMVKGEHKWNAMIRDITAQLEMKCRWLIGI